MRRWRGSKAKGALRPARTRFRAQQGAAAMPTVFNAYQQAQNALDAQMAAANPGLYTVRSTGALPTYTL